MKRFFRYIAIVVAFATTSFQPANAARPSAKSVVEKVVKQLREAPSLSVAFTVSQNSGSEQGRLTVAGRRFALQSPNMRVWFDGKTQWAYSPENNEVNISLPTASEVAESNPMAVLTDMNSAWNVRRLDSSASVDRIELIPKGKSNFARAEITFSNATGLPTAIKIVGTDRSVTSVTIQSLSVGKALPVSSFRFNAADFPGAEIVDLR